MEDDRGTCIICGGDGGGTVDTKWGRLIACSPVHALIVRSLNNNKSVKHLNYDDPDLDAPLPPTVFVVVEQSEGSIDDVLVFIDKEKAIEHSANWMVEFASDHYPDFLDWFEKYGHPEDDSVPFWTNCFPFNNDTAIDIFERTIMEDKNAV